MTIYTAYNTIVGFSFGGEARTLVGFDSLSFNDNVTTNSVGNDSGGGEQGFSIAEKQGLGTGSDLDITVTFAEQDFIDFFKELFKTAEEGFVIATNKSTGKSVSYRVRARTSSIQDSIDNSAKGKIMFRFNGWLVNV
jgi:hypothetical protein